MNDSCYEKTQSMRAVTQYMKCGNPECSAFPHDYKCGWIDGFYEVATGGNCCPPSFAPERYYRPSTILKDCDNRRHAYYSGWQDGAAHAEQFPDTHYLRIYETCECPFPRCEKPCVSGSYGSCGPCGVEFVGMSASNEMIETVPVAMPVAMPVAPAMTQPGQYLPSTPIETDSNIRIVPGVNGNTPAGLIDGSTINEIPVPQADPATQSSSLIRTNPSSQVAKSDSPNWNPPMGGFVRLAKSTQPDVAASQSDETESDHVVIVEAVSAHHEMLESEPVVKFVK